MKFEKFLLNAVAKEINEPDTNADINQQDPVNKILYKFAFREFNKVSQLPEKFLIDDSDQDITLFSEKFTASNKESNKEELLVNAASLLDEMALHNRFWFVIPYDKLYVSDNNRIVFNWFELNKYCAVDQMKIPPQIKSYYQDIISNKLNSGMITNTMLNANLTIEAFVNFLIKILYPQLPSKFQLPSVKWLNVALSKIGIVPEEKYFLQKTLHSSSAFNSCKEIITQLFRAKKESICTPVKIEELVWDFNFHTEHGRNKKSTQNEDSYTVFSTPDKKSLLFMVADGVSTANIGRGKIISSMILEIIEDEKEKIIKFMEDNAVLPSKDWMIKCKNQIVDVLKIVNDSCVEELNNRLNKNPVSEKQPMSSTVIIGFVNRNRVVAGHLGDSHLFYIYSKKIMRLNEEHNVMADRISRYIDNPQPQPFKDDKTDKHLERVIPLSDYDDTAKKFIKADLENKITFMEFYPKKESVIIAATDGLIDSLGTTGNEFENEQNILKAYSEAMEQSANLEDIARIMGRNADKKAGLDNITIIVLTGKEIKVNSKLQNKGDFNRKKMKKIE